MSEKMLNVVVTYPVYFQVNEADLEGKDEEEVRAYVLDKADYFLQTGSVSPKIVECDNHGYLID